MMKPRNLRHIPKPRQTPLWENRIVHLWERVARDIEWFGRILRKAQIEQRQKEGGG